jgi:galactose mutarotase-like enzyme
VSSKGAELVSAISSDGKEYIWQADKSYWGRHAPILFPVCGRLLGSEYTLDGVRYEMGSHGFARDSEFELVEAIDDSLTLVLRQNEQTAKVYPFDFTLSVKYSLCDSELTMTIEVKNDSAKTMPYMIGWHPGFNIDGLIDNYFIKVKNADTVKRNYMKPSLFIEPEAVDYPLSDGIFKLTEKEIYGEDTLIFSDIGGESLLMRGEKTILRIKQSDNLPYYAIWKAPKSGAEYICLEPWSDIPADGITPECFDNRKMSRLDAGKSETYVFTVEFAE